MENLHRQAQEAVEELWVEGGIPFKLTARKVEAGEHRDYYRVYFFDSRFPARIVYWNPARESFKSAVGELVKLTLGRRGKGKEDG